MTKYPFYSLIATAIFVAGAIIVLLFGDSNNPEVTIFLGVILANLPGLVAAFMSERNNTAIRNGVMVEKVRQGATAAIQEQQVITRTGPVASAELAALTALLERTNQTLQTNTNATQQNTNGQDVTHNGPTV